MLCGAWGLIRFDMQNEQFSVSPVHKEIGHTVNTTYLFKDSPNHLCIRTIEDIFFIISTGKKLAADYLVIENSTIQLIVLSQIRTAISGWLQNKKAC